MKKKPLTREQEFKGLTPFATVRQRQYMESIVKYGSIEEAAKKCGVGERRVYDALQRLRKLAALRGYSPEHDMNRVVPDGYLVKGVSTYYDKTGEQRGQWVKSKLDQERMAEIAREAWISMSDELPRLPPLPAPPATLEALANLYTLTDSHVGALCWHREGGEDWDLTIAESILTRSFQALVAAAPAAHTGIVAQLGDFLHMDGLTPVTPLHGHVLDADSRFQKVVQVACRILRRVVDLALQKHQKVIVLMAEGNHDIASSVWLRVMFMALYENEPRVQVIDSPLPYYLYQHGNTMIGWHHGHLKKTDDLPMLFAAQFAKEWGATEHRYIHTGHKHCVEEIEHSGVTVIQHPTLAARDAFAARGGWIAERQATVITYHNVYGQVARNTITPEMLESPPETKE